MVKGSTPLIIIFFLGDIMYGYYSNWKRLIPSSDEIDFVCFKFDFTGNYALKMIKDDFFIPVICEDMAIMIPVNQIADAVDYLRENGYAFHNHSVVKF